MTILLLYRIKTYEYFGFLNEFVNIKKVNMVVVYPCCEVHCCGMVVHLHCLRLQCRDYYLCGRWYIRIVTSLEGTNSLKCPRTKEVFLGRGCIPRHNTHFQGSEVI